jgi:putative NADH-flavin reductase
MQLTIFGGTGASGRLVVDAALGAGHEVTAYARNPTKLAAARGLTIVEGELHHADRINTAIDGSAAVISLLGPIRGVKGHPVTDATKVIVHAMEAKGVQRLIATGTPSATDPEDRSHLGFRLAVAAIRTFLPAAYREIRGTADAIRGSELDWTLVRLPILTDRQHPRPAATGHVGSRGVGIRLSRNVLAHFLLEQLADRTWVHRAPLISNASSLRSPLG